MNPARLPDRRPLLLAAGLSIGLALFIAGLKLLTAHVWEDFFITYRHSENLVRGLGLVYQAGERVHGFTSPLNVLVPAGLHALQPQGDYGFPLWGFVLVSLVALAAGSTAQIMSWLRPAPAGGFREPVVFVLLLALQIKFVAFSFNGQESALWAGFLLLAIAAINRGVAEHWLAAGLAFGGLMWTRPDSPVHIFWLGLGALAFPQGPRAATGRGLLRAAAVCTAVYLPWFSWAWWYYGSPVPHTILAKMGSYGQGLTLSGWLQQWPAAVARAFEPIYSEAGGWPASLHWIALAMGTACAAAWLLPRADVRVRRASLLFGGSAGYLAVVGADGFMFPWYFVPCGVSGAIILAHGLTRPTVPWIRLAALLTIVAALGYGTANSIAQLRLHQQLIEEQTRRPVGLWLREHMKEADTVFLEPIGYIGYYSGRHILDWPGLVSPSVVQARRASGNDLWRTIARLRPDWLVFRPIEAAGFARQEALARDYMAVASVDTLPRLQAYLSLPGYEFLSSDARFIVFQRRPDPAAALPKP